MLDFDIALLMTIGFVSGYVARIVSEWASNRKVK